MKNQNYRAKFITLLSIAFAFVVVLSTTQKASAQRYLTEIRSGSEAKGIAQFANDLSAFLEIAESLEGNTAVSPVALGRLERAGKKVKDGTSNLQSNLKGLVTKLKNQNRWDEKLDSEINELFGDGSVRGFFQRNGGRKILTDADSAINAISRDVDTIINNAKNSKSNASIKTDGIFMQTAFAESSASGKKVKFKCVVLGIAIFGAELVKADRTAENLDGFFDKSCGAGATTTT